MSKVVRFYRGEIPTLEGDWLKNIWEWDNDFLEGDHSFIQWMFPSPERSGLNRDAPVLTLDDHLEFMQDYDLQANMKKSFLRILDFFGFELVQDDDEIVIEAMIPTEDRPYPLSWLGEFNHNMLRVTRILKSLRMTGLERYARAFFEALRVYRNTVSANTFSHWTKAIDAREDPAIRQGFKPTMFEDPL